VTIFADASALIAIIADEPEADALADLLETEPLRLCSAVSVWETIAGLCRSYTFSVPAARAHVRRFLKTGGFQFVGIGEREFEIAVDAYAQYGRGRHPARLNMGDCYAYACAKANRAKLLFKGEDFTKTDITPAGSSIGEDETGN
jgi:ribonuclease VapC